MKNILKYLLVAILIPLVFGSCANDADRDWATADPSFKLYNTTLASNVLYPTMETNPFRLTWDNTVAPSSEYTVQLSTTSDFSKPIVFGTSKTNTYSTTIGALNTALLSAGYVPYKTQPVYFRVVSGSNVSNVISFDVTTYPSAVPVITAPAAGTAIVLDSTKPTETATKVIWTDYSYGTDVVYLVEAAKKGTTNFVTIASVNNLRMVNVTNKAFNDALIGAGFTPNVAADVDIRVTATTKSTGGTVTKTSNVVTINVTPYLSFKDMFFVGDATAAGWNTNNGNPALFRDPANTNKFYYEGYFAAGAFKVIEKLGENTWQPQWGQKDGKLAVNDGTGSDPDTFNIPAAGYYRFEMDIVNRTFSLSPVAAPAKTYTSLGLIGDFNSWGGDVKMTQSAFDPHLWVVRDLVIGAAGGLKIRANGGWDVNWGTESKWSGIATQGGSNIPVDAGTYDVFFNDADGSYIFVKK